MLNFHDFVHEKKEKDEENIINQFVKNIKLKASLIYFDEFQVFYKLINNIFFFLFFFFMNEVMKT